MELQNFEFSEYMAMAIKPIAWGKYYTICANNFPFFPTKYGCARPYERNEIRSKKQIISFLLSS